MILYGLKLWSNNAPETFQAAAELSAAGKVDCLEVYHDPTQALDWSRLAFVQNYRVAVHNTHSQGFHEFIITPEQENIWRGTLELADFFKAAVIVVHPGRDHDVVSFFEELKKIEDERIYIENMAGLDIFEQPMFGQKITDLLEISAVQPICFDFEKAVKAACWQKIPYQEYINQALELLKPRYFHISGGDKDSPVDQHLNLWEATFDVSWIAERLLEYSQQKEVCLLFETPKVGASLENDLKNIEYFKSSH